MSKETVKNLNKEYEFTVILKDQPEDAAQKLLKRYEDLLTRDGGEIIRRAVNSTQKLAYPIKKQHRGIYGWYTLASKKENISEVERVIRFDENILRYMVIKVADKVDVETRRAEIKKQELLEAQMAEENAAY